jgi:hypothetical protein
MPTPTSQDQSEPEVYFNEKEFDYENFKETFDRDADDLSTYQGRCSDSSDIRRCEWVGKTPDLKKNSENAFPYKGASDTEVHLVEHKISTNNAIKSNARRKSQIKAYPRRAEDIERASNVSVFLKWLRDSGIPSFPREMELADNYGEEKGIMVAYCDYLAPRKTSYKKLFDIEAIQQSFPEQPEMIEILVDEDRVDEALEAFSQIPGWEVNRARAKKALAQLRKTGVAEIPVAVYDDGSPLVQVLDPSAEFYAPSYTTSFEDATRCHIRKPMSPQEVLSRVDSEEWDKEWAEYAVSFQRGIDSIDTKGTRFLGMESSNTSGREADLIDVIFTFERLIDKIDMSEGYYLTVWSPDIGGDESTPDFARRTLLSGLTSFPFVVMSQSYDTRTLYDVQTTPELLKSAQKNMKVIRDSSMDEQAYAVSPAMIAPPSWSEGRVGPGGIYSTRQGQEPKFLNKESRFDVNLALEKALVDEANAQVGLDPEDPLSTHRQQAKVNRSLLFTQEVLKKVYEMYKLKGPDELFIQVSGRPEPVQFLKDQDEAEMDVTVSFNTMYDDPEKTEKIISGLFTIMQNDNSGRVNGDAVTDALINSIDPSLADQILMPTEEANEKIKNETISDISAMASGVPMGAPEGATQARIGVVRGYLESPTGLAKYNSDEAFQFLLNEYIKQLEMKIEQNINNPVRGRLGTDAAEMGGVVTQGIN